MALSQGTKLGPYEILSPAGAGGMGEVYRAHDSRLGRDVAIKVLPAHLSSNPDLRQRFEREARAISSLQHPHICTLFDIGHDGGTDYLVLEFLEGETLSKRLERGPLPLNELVKVGVEIADALDKAHRQGIIHRDLKPGNIMLTKSGAKLMDFGLAKPSVGALTASAATGGAVTPSLPTSPIIATKPVSPLTAQGSIVGTFQYMSPEQIQGLEADARSDIFAFGAVLYEMATAKRAFDGKSQLSVASAILEKEPEPISTVQPTAPPALEHVIRTCLAKDADERWQTAHDVLLNLRFAGSSTMSASPAIKAPRKWWRDARIAWGLAAVAVLAAVLFAVFGARSTTSAVMRVQISAPDNTSFDITGDFAGPPVLSPNGKYIVFSATGPGTPKSLWIRPLSSLIPTRLDGTQNSAFPFWSPDSRFIAFFSDGRLKKISVTGGPVTSLADAPNPRGGAWGSSGVIVFSSNFRGPLSRINADGGAVTSGTQISNSKLSTHRWPHFLPDGKHFLYFGASHDIAVPEATGIYFSSLDGGTDKLVIATDGDAQYANGYLLYHQQNALVAQRFDPGSGTLSGEAFPIVERVAYDPGTWKTIFSVSAEGEMVYYSGSLSVGTQLEWFDQAGKQLSIATERGGYRDPAISPDGRRVAFAKGDPQWDVWTLDTTRGVPTRLTFGNGTSNFPSWSPDAKQIVYTSVQNGGRNGTSILIKAANGTGAEESVLTTKEVVIYSLPQFTPDGKSIVAIRGAAPTGWGIYMIPLSGERKATLVIGPANESASITEFRVSRDGRWIAYTSNESGRDEVYITSFPVPSGKWQVSSEGGNTPRWRADGKELIYWGIDNWVRSVDFDAKGGDVVIGAARRLFRQEALAVGTPYDISPDAKRFLFNVAPHEAPAPITFVVNWPAELKK